MNNYILKEKNNIKILINKNIIELMTEYKEYEANKYKNKILLIIIGHGDIITLKSEELINTYYEWYWNVDDKKIIQSKNMSKTKEIKPYEPIILGLEVLKEYI